MNRDDLEKALAAHRARGKFPQVIFFGKTEELAPGSWTWRVLVRGVKTGALIAVVEPDNETYGTHREALAALKIGVNQATETFMQGMPEGTEKMVIKDTTIKQDS